MSDLNSKAGTTAREHRRHSFTEFPQTVGTPDFIPHHKTSIGSPTGTCQRFSRTSLPESEEVIRRVRSLSITSPDHDSDHSCRPPPKRPYVPSIEQLQQSRKAKDEEIDRLLRPKKAPLPPHLPPQDDAYVDATLTKRGVISKTAREQVADKDIARLRPHQWLNDEIINFYGQLILSRSESQKETSMSAPVDGYINGLVNGVKDKVKAVEKKSLLNVHYFNTFFWPKLIREGYDKGRLAKWTKKVTFDPNASTYRGCSSLVFASSTYSQRM